MRTSILKIGFVSAFLGGLIGCQRADLASTLPKDFVPEQPTEVVSGESWARTESYSVENGAHSSKLAWRLGRKGDLVTLVFERSTGRRCERAEFSFHEIDNRGNLQLPGKNKDVTQSIRFGLSEWGALSTAGFEEHRIWTSGGLAINIAPHFIRAVTCTLQTTANFSINESELLDAISRAFAPARFRSLSNQIALAPGLFPDNIENGSASAVIQFARFKRQTARVIVDRNSLVLVGVEVFLDELAPGQNFWSYAPNTSAVMSVSVEPVVATPTDLASHEAYLKLLNWHWSWLRERTTFGATKPTTNETKAWAQQAFKRLESETWATE